MGERPHTRCCVTHAQHNTKHSTPVTLKLLLKRKGEEKPVWSILKG